MEKLKELNIKEKSEIIGGGPISVWVCEKIKDLRSWVNHYEAPKMDGYSYIKLKMSGL